MKSETKKEIREAVFSLGTVIILSFFAFTLANRCSIRDGKNRVERKELYEAKIQSCVDDGFKKYQCKNWIK